MASKNLDKYALYINPEYMVVAYVFIMVSIIYCFFIVYYDGGISSIISLFLLIPFIEYGGLVIVTIRKYNMHRRMIKYIKSNKRTK